MKITVKKLKHIIEEADKHYGPFSVLTPAEVDEVRSYIADGDEAMNFINSPVFEKLYQYYIDEIPYGVAKGRDGEPDVWILDRVEYDERLSESTHDNIRKSRLVEAIHKIIKEDWDNAAIMGKARERRMNPRVWNRKQATRDFYAGPKAPVPPSTGPDPSGEPARMAPAPKLTSNTRNHYGEVEISYYELVDLFPESIKKLKEKCAAHDTTPEHCDYFMDKNDDVYAHGIITGESFGWDPDRDDWIAV